MKLRIAFTLLFFFLTSALCAEREKINLSIVISGGVSLGAYEAGYNWAMVKMLAKEKSKGALVEPDLRSVTGASAGSINALLTAMYWCQKDSIPLHNTINDNLFYETWVNLGIEDLLIKHKDPQNKSSLFTRRELERKGEKIIEHLKKPIFKSQCQVPLGVAVTKATPIIETVAGIKIKNQNFSVPLVFKVKNQKGIVENKILPSSTDFYISIPDIEKDRHKLINLLFASGAFPGAFQQVKLDYEYKGKKHSHYFIDGGLYDNVPLDLATALDKNTSHFLFINPSNLRKEILEKNTEEAEQIPLGFITTNLMPVFSSFDIMQSMKLYEAINQNFREGSKKTLILSSRYHPITGKFLGHFGAFLDQNFREYDYYVGIYDAIYHLAKSLKTKAQYADFSQTSLMSILKKRLGVHNDPKALAAYTLFLNTEFQHTSPKTKDKFSAIYNAFNIKKPNSKRYTGEEFKRFLGKLDTNYLKKDESSFLAYAKKDIDNWYKKPLREVINRITILENDKAEVFEDHSSVATIVNVSAWASTSFTKEKEGFYFNPLNVPQDKGKETFKTALRFLPSELASDLKNGGFSLGYNALYYAQMGPVDGLEGKVSYVAGDDTDNFVRVDLSAFKEYDDFIKFGLGVSFFGDVQGAFYKRDTAYGLNAYIDLIDIFRFTYVRRHGNLESNGYLYFGIENIPSLIYWLNR
ncbi:MAG: hypothetical protein DRQ78_02655 [Epsilonproteobacteria bacterium]|nr:MAG: hypothetical protein DRQ78_02655 [Campylobacterota bacterium]